MTAQAKKHQSKAARAYSIYVSQVETSKKRPYGPPAYTRKELKEWLYSQPDFHVLYDNWKNSGFKRNMSPSVDRLNDYDGYRMSNIRLVTWKENHEKSFDDRKNGINNKTNTAVEQYSKDGVFISRFHSIKKAERVLDISKGNINKVLSGKRKTAGGYIWKEEV